MAFRVALTFDAEHPDRPAIADGTDATLAALARHRVAATFFLQGRWVEAYPALARRVRDAGHLIGNHSFYHARMPLLSADGFETDVRAAERAIRQHLGASPRPWFRFPFGAGAGDPALHERLGRLGYRNVHWDVEAKEWRTRASVRGVEDAVVQGARAHGDSAVVLLHPWPTPTARALPGIIDRLVGDGATFVRLDELPSFPTAPGSRAS